MSKYREKVEELIKTYRVLIPYQGKASQEIADELLRNVICQLAEEVEVDIAVEQDIKFCNIFNQKNMYLRKQVEELLQKQRELCYDNAELISTSNHSELLLSKDSILNAKLEF